MSIDRFRDENGNLEVGDEMRDYIDHQRPHDMTIAQQVDRGIIKEQCVYCKNTVPVKNGQNLGDGRFACDSCCDCDPSIG